MQRRNLLLTSLTATFAVTMSAIPEVTMQAAYAEVGNARSNQVVRQIAAVSTLATGNFVASEHPTSGGATIVVKNGKRYLEFDGKFKSDDGPDLFVLLHKQGSPSRYRSSDYVNLGRLQSTDGKQRYAIPDGVNLADFKSAVIWCRQFSATFGFAKLNHMAAKPAKKVISSGNFVDAEHPTKGMAMVVKKNGKKYLKFDSKFKSDNGPDLFVLLHKQGSPSRYRRSDYVNLGRLKSVSGEQMYEIPDGVDVSDFKSAVIWCRQFSATFGFARLS